MGAMARGPGTASWWALCEIALPDDEEQSYSDRCFQHPYPIFRSLVRGYCLLLGGFVSLCPPFAGDNFSYSGFSSMSIRRL